MSAKHMPIPLNERSNIPFLNNNYNKITLTKPASSLSLSSSSSSSSSCASSCSHSHPVRSHPVRLSASKLDALNSHPRQSFWNLTCCCLFSLLPDDIMLFNIFSFCTPSELLSTISLVSTRWNWLAGDRLLWRSIDLSSSTFASQVDDQILDALISKHGKYAEVLKLCNCTKLNSSHNNDHNSERAALTMIGPSMLNLRELHLCNISSVSDDIIVSIAASCHDLSSVSLFGCKQITDVSVIALTDNCPQLTDLSVRGCHRLTDAAFNSVHNVSLTALNVGGCRNLTSVAMTKIANASKYLTRFNGHGIALSDAGIISLATKCRLLSTLHLSSSNPFGGNPRVTDLSIRSLALLTHLTVLNLQGSSNVTDDAIVATVPALTRLQRLNLGGVYRLTDKSMNALHRNCRLTHLSLFQLFNITDVAVIKLIRRLRALVHLDLHSCVGLSNNLLEALAVRRDENTVNKEIQNYIEIMQTDQEQIDQENKGKNVTSLDSDDALPSPLSSSSSSPSSSSSSSYFYLGPSLVLLDLGSIRSLSVEDVSAFKSVRANINVVHY